MPTDTTMIHLSEGTLQSLLDDELPLDERSAVLTHLRACDPCAAELEILRSASATFRSALHVVDRPAPVRWAPVPLRTDRARRWSGAPVALGRAAVLVMLAAGFAAAVVPGSPVRGWLETIWSPAAAPVATAPLAAPAPPPIEPESAAPAGVAILPSAGAVVIALQSPAPGLRVRVGVADGQRASVAATGAAADARFRTTPGRIEVIGAGAGEIRIDLPRGVNRARVEVDGEPFLSKADDQFRIFAPVENAADTAFLFRVGP